MYLMTLWNSDSTKNIWQLYMLTASKCHKWRKRVKHIILVYNVHPSCKIKNLGKILHIIYTYVIMVYYILLYQKFISHYFDTLFT